MANITMQVDIPKPCKIDAPVYGHKAHGWYAKNSIVVSDCVPQFRNSGGGVCDEDLTDLPTAIKQSMTYLDHRIAEAEKLKGQLLQLLNSKICR